MMQPSSRAAVRLRRRSLAAGLALALALPAAAGASVSLRTALPVHRSAQPSAVTWPVTSCADDGSAGTLRSVVAGAASGDTIDLSQLACSTITLTQGEIAIPQDDLLLSGPGAAALAVSGNEASAVFAHGGAGTLTIDGLGVADGYTTHAGAGVSSSGSVALSGVVVANCRVSPTSYASGGGVYAQGDITVAYSTIHDNYGYHGGGLWTMGNLTLTASTVADNAAYMGGGIWTHGDGFTLTGSTVSGNHAGFNSGGLLAYSVSGTGSGTAAIVDSTISGNLSDDYTGGAYIANMNVELANSTVAFNRSSRGCNGLGIGGRFTYAVSLDSALLADNSRSIAGTAYDFATYISSPYTLTASHNLVVSSRTPLPSDTIVADPLLLPLADNGGPTQTHALAGSSPAIDAGDNALGLADDQRGSGYARVAGAAADIGAFEVQQVASTPNVVKSFMPSAVMVDALSTLTITLGNPTSSVATLTAPLTDALPAPVVVANPPVASTTCPSGVVEAPPAAASVTLDAGAQIPAQSTCTITLNVIAGAAGQFTNVIAVGALQADSGSNADAATATLVVSGAPIPPTLSKQFAPTTIAAGATSTLTITLANAHANAATLTADLTDTLPVPLVVADPSQAATTCTGGVVSASAGAGAVTLAAGAQIPAGTCTISVSVTAATPGTYLNTMPAGALQTDFGNSPDAANAGLMVVPAGPLDRIFFDGFDGASP